MTPPRPTSSRSAASAAFSLIEVVVAVGIFAFVGVALIGLFSVGLKINRESVDELEATALAQALLNIRKASPTNIIPGIVLPRLDQASEIVPASPLFLAADGSVTNNAANARFGLVYRIKPYSAPASVSSVYVCLFWPPAAAAETAPGRCEIISKVSLP